ncbi:hypothetical protein ACX80S_15175 [Arthrobacter sp. RHLT1-20]
MEPIAQRGTDGAEWSASSTAAGVVRERVKVVPREDMVKISRG